MITAARLAFRLQRFEILAVSVAATIIAVSAIVVRLRLDAVGVPADCWQQYFGDGGSMSDACSALAQQFLAINEYEAGKVMAAMALLPLFVGLLLGVPIVAREIEGGTAPTAWALVGARSRWLWRRLAPGLVLLVLSLGFLALASDFLWAGREPWGPAVHMGDLGLHGPVVVAKGLAVMGLAALVGAVSGRILPAFVLGLVLCFVLLLGNGTLTSAWLQDEATHHATTVVGNPEALFPGGTAFFQGWLAPDGRILIQAADAILFAPSGVDPYEWLYNGGLRVVQMGVPGSMYPTWSLIETAAFGAIGLVALGLVFLVVDRRRPM